MLTHKTLTCCHKGCFATITLHPDDERRLRKTHEWFYCPAGHQQHFSGKTDEEKQIAQLKREVEMWRDDHRELTEDLQAEHDRIRVLARAMQVCPLGCGWQGNRRLSYYGGSDLRFLERVGWDLADHLAHKHNVKVKVEDGRIVAV